jgi:hypothetical protein
LSGLKVVYNGGEELVEVINFVAQKKPWKHRGTLGNPNPQDYIQFLEPYPHNAQ